MATLPWFYIEALLLRPLYQYLPLLHQFHTYVLSLGPAARLFFYVPRFYVWSAGHASQPRGVYSATSAVARKRDNMECDFERSTLRAHKLGWASHGSAPANVVIRIHNHTCYLVPKVDDLQEIVSQA